MSGCHPCLRNGGRKVGPDSGCVDNTEYTGARALYVESLLCSCFANDLLCFVFRLRPPYSTPVVEWWARWMGTKLSLRLHKRRRDGTFIPKNDVVLAVLNIQALQ